MMMAGAMPPAAHMVTRPRLRSRRSNSSKIVPISMEPGDALVFHSLLHHYTAPNTSGLRRRAAGIRSQQADNGTAARPNVIRQRSVDKTINMDSSQLDRPRLRGSRRGAKK